MSGITTTVVPTLVTMLTDTRGSDLVVVADQIVTETNQDEIVTTVESQNVETTVADTFASLVTVGSSVVTTLTAQQGPRGLPGEMSAAILGTFECGESISSSSLVHLSPIDGLLYRANQEDMLSASGYTIPGASAGASLTIYRLGTLNGLSGLTPGQPRWLGINGQSRATMPTTGLIQSVGYASDVDKIFIELDEPEEVED